MASSKFGSVSHVTDENASRLLAGRGGVNAHRLTGNGDFVQVAENTLVRFQVAEPTRRDFERLERQPVAAEPVGPVDIIDVPVPPEEPTPEFDLAWLLAATEEANSGAEPCVDARTLAVMIALAGAGLLIWIIQLARQGDPVGYIMLTGLGVLATAFS
ncbi:MAG: hypothetical protein AB1801_14140 [Chloroflexota bacterium]